MKYFHFTLGPVQGFVSQARRTRDFWAGSFLLSWLSGVAMAATQKLGGEIVFPIPPDDYLHWIEHGKGKGDAPRQGVIPNRFKASVPDAFNGKLVEDAVRQAWIKLANWVWKCDELDKIAGDKTRGIWDQQNKHFWEISWALTNDADASDLLDRRKNWRNHLPPPEPGVKCAIMEGWQELSGIEDMKKDGNDTRREFWEKIQGIGNGSMSDFADGEMLCALAFVKRRFARHFKDENRKVEFSASISLGIETLNLKGWKLETGVPSFAYMAAVHWLEQLNNHGDKQRVKGALDIGSQLVQNDEWNTPIECLCDTNGRNRIPLDGNLFFTHTRANEKLFKDRTKIVEFEKALESLKLPEKAPTPFYAVLMMDGDSLGAQMSVPNNQKQIADSLNAFTSNVPDVVKEKNGFLIYAGGDDVLALLPLEDALPCALACREAYQQAFKKHGAHIKTSLSGAVIFAHVKTALGEVLRQAHTVLDDEAKEGAGRDAIAIRVLKPGGDHLTWAQPWEIALEGDELKLEKLVKEFQSASGEDGQFSSKFFYRMRERFILLKDGLNEDQQTALLAADYIASKPAKRIDPVTQNPRKITMNEAKTIIEPLLDQCRPKVREFDKEKSQWTIKPSNKPAKADAALLVRFLAHKGVEAR